MTQEPEQLTAAEISRLAGVTRATVSNWRRRHPDFPKPSGGSESSPTYERAEVEAWLAARGQLPEPSPEDALSAELRRQPADAPSSRFFPVVVAAARMAPDELDKLATSDDAPMARSLTEAARPHAVDMPGVGKPGFSTSDVPILRALLTCVRDAGGSAALDVLTERQGTDPGVRGGYHTPSQLTELMADLVTSDDVFPPSVLDPACGTGGILATAARNGATTLYGQDIATTQAGQAAVRLGVLAPDAVTSIKAGDTLRADAFPEVLADAILCNPPFADRDWGHDELAYDGRWAYGLPPKSESELAWVQHCLAHVKPGGLVVVLMPPGSAERPAGRRVRAELARRGAMRAIIALAPGTAPPFNIGLHLWVLRRPDDERAEVPPILFVDTSNQDQTDWATLHKGIVETWRTYVGDPENFRPVPRSAHAVPVIELLNVSTDLTPTRHVHSSAHLLPPAEFAAEVNDQQRQMRNAAEAMRALGAQEWRPTGSVVVTWRTATVEDLQRGNALSLHRAITSPRSKAGTDEQLALPYGDDTRVLTARDVTKNAPASGRLADQNLMAPVVVEEGDVLLSEIMHRDAGARVADTDDAGSLLGAHLLLFRPDPERLDPWFLAGFLAADDNLRGAATGSSVVRVSAKRLRVPLLPLDRQRQYGKAFRHAYELRKAADLATRLADEAAGRLALGLTGGVLDPPDSL